MRTITCVVFCSGAFVVALDEGALDEGALDEGALDEGALDEGALDVVGYELVLPRDNTVLVDVVGEVLGDPPHAAITKLAAATNVAAAHRRGKLFLLITSSGSFQIAQDESLLE